MPTAEDVELWISFLLLVSVLGLAVWHFVNPKNPVSRGLVVFWNTPAIKKFSMFIWKAFGVCFFGYLAIVTISWYFESGFYPRQREVAVYFKAQQWIEGEIHTCYSEANEPYAKLGAELGVIDCSLGDSEFHVLKVTFWGSIKPDRKKIWKCERSSATMTCKLQ
jgi:hypothetical protein